LSNHPVNGHLGHVTSVGGAVAARWQPFAVASAVSLRWFALELPDELQCSERTGCVPLHFDLRVSLLVDLLAEIGRRSDVLTTRAVASSPDLPRTSVFLGSRELGSPSDK